MHSWHHLTRPELELIHAQLFDADYKGKSKKGLIKKIEKYFKQYRREEYGYMETPSHRAPKLSPAKRRSLPDSDFIFPENAPRGGWPIPDIRYARIALRWARTGFRVKKGSKKARKIIRTVLKRYPSLRQESGWTVGK